MTKVTIIGEDEKDDIKLKIVFTESLSVDKTIINNIQREPKECKFIELVSKYGMFDIMFTHDGNRDLGVLYLGHFNDGIV